MRTVIILISIFVASFAARAQLAATFVISSNDIVQRSIMVSYSGADTNGTKVSVRFEFTDKAAKALAEFYLAHTFGDEVYLQCGNFTHPFTIDEVKIFPRTGYMDLSEQDGKALIAGLRGER
jgi:hypothetical protein